MTSKTKPYVRVQVRVTSTDEDEARADAIEALTDRGVLESQITSGTVYELRQNGQYIDFDVWFTFKEVA